MRNAIIIAGALAALAFVVGRATAAGIPIDEPLVYSGILENEGALDTGDREIEFALFQSGNNTAVCSQTSTVAVQNGAFSIPLNESCVQAFRDNRDLSVGLTIDGTSLPQEKVSAAPYALEAERAVDADSAAFADNVAPGSIDSAALATNAVITAKISNSAVTSAKIADGAIVAADLGSSAVTEVKITNNTITTAKLADAAVTSSKLAAGAVALTSSIVTGTACATLSSTTTCSCPAGTVVTGGGADGAFDGSDFVLPLVSRPTTSGWQTQCVDVNVGQIVACAASYAVCSRATP